MMGNKHTKLCVKRENNKFLCVVTCHSYNSSFAHVIELVSVASIDFPSLDAHDIKVLVFGGDWHKRQVGIEFIVSGEPEGYELVTDSLLTRKYPTLN